MFNIDIKTDTFEKLISEIITSKLLPKLEEIVITHSYPLEIKGYDLASQMIQVPKDTLKSRVRNGLYIQGTHYRKNTNSKQSNIIFNRDSILEFEKLRKVK
jgi:activator of HSP90 ATPase